MVEKAGKVRRVRGLKINLGCRRSTSYGCMFVQPMTHKPGQDTLLNTF